MAGSGVVGSDTSALLWTGWKAPLDSGRGVSAATCADRGGEIGLGRPQKTGPVPGVRG